MKLIKILSIFLMLMMVAACDKLDDKLLDNPNWPTPETADINLYFNEVQLDFKNFYGGMSNFGEQLTRMEHMYGPLFANAYSGGSFNDVWYQAYAAMFKNVNAMIPVAEKANLTTHVGAAKVLKAYALMVLVDNFGDVPLTEANNIEITNPKLDPGADVYKAAIALLDEVDAPLDEANVLRYVDLIKTFSEKSQFLLISHNKRTMEVANTLYGVTMEELGVSKVLSARLMKAKDSKEKLAEIKNITPATA